ncbi:hypothetical protein ID866_10910 [Astraeus odoratus]|nr:hypothetical protein ID866_10910 [Astraeus odoratus]
MLVLTSFPPPTHFTDLTFGMLRLGCAKLVFKPLKFPAPPCSLSAFVQGSMLATPALAPHRSSSSTANYRSDLFDYTSGRWVLNEALRRAERKLVFNVDALCRLAATSVGRDPADVADVSKLGEGGFNRAFLITMADQFQMVARIPYPIMVPKYFAVASEVATMDFFRSAGLPIPRVYGYSPDSNNAAGTEYIFMEFISGTKLSDVWRTLSEQDVVSIVRDLTRLESNMKSIPFPAGGSLYYTSDLEKVAGGAGVPLEDGRFCVGPDTSLPLWYGRRTQLDVSRGPYASAEAALEAPALKELAYLKQFGQPLLPFRRERRPGYKYQEQLPSDHVQNLHRYLLLAPSLVPTSPGLRQFCIRHPDFRQGNVFVAKSPDSGWRVVSLFDWQHTTISPLFLADLPKFLLYDGGPISQSATPPSRPENFDDLDETERTAAEEAYRSRLVYYHYFKDTEELNRLHYATLTDPYCALRSRLFTYASSPWEGETLELKAALIEATQMWRALTGKDTPCPVAFDADDVRETMELEKVQAYADKGFNVLQGMLELGPEGWVPTTDRYEKAVALSKQMKEEGLADAISESEKVEIMEHWPWDDMDEEAYM